MADAALLPPCPELAGCVRAFYWREIGPADLLGAGSGRTVIPPGPYPGLVWMLQGQARLVHVGGQDVAQALPPTFVGGPRRHRFESVALGPYRSFGVVFQPAALALLTGHTMDDLADRIVPAPEVLPHDWTDLLQAVADAPDHTLRIERLQQWLRPRWAALQPPGSLWDRLAVAAWQRPLQHLACAAFNWTQRHFQRRSKALTGLRAGEVERQLRLERALIALRDGQGNAAAVAAAHGYADQAHFTREARALYGAPPAELARRLREAPTDGDWLLRL